MSVSLSELRVGGLVAVLGALLLAGCGGGGDELTSPVANSPISPPVVDLRPTADAGQLGSVASRCGVNSFEDFGATTINSGSFLATFNGLSQVVGYLASGDYFDTSVRMDVAIPQTDFRIASLSQGHDTHRMGVAMNGPFLVGALACVKGVGRVTVVDGRTEVHWFSDAWPQLPVQSLPGTPVAGLEWFGNFEPGNPTIYFTLDASEVARPDALSLCHLSSTDAWTCESVSSIYNGVSHTFASQVAGHGVYVLTEAQQPGS
jgi:hypothetical protein